MIFNIENKILYEHNYTNNELTENNNNLDENKNMNKTHIRLNSFKWV